MSQAVDVHLEGLFKELTCTICQDVIEPPVGRLPCCHYFCRACVSQAIRYAPKCPECSAKATRRDVADDPTMDRIATAVRGLQDCRGALAAAARAAAAGPPPAADGDAIPWLQGVDDAVFAESPTRSLSASAMGHLRGGGDADGAAAAAAAGGRGRSPSPMVLHRRDSDQGTSKAAPAAPAAPAAAAGKAGGRKRGAGTGAGSQSIQKWLKKDAAGAKTSALVPAAAAATPQEQQQQQPDGGSPDASASLLLPVDAEDAARRLDDIVAGLDVAESAPPSAAAAAAAEAPPPAAQKAEPKKQGAAKKKRAPPPAEAPAPSGAANKENRSGGGTKKRRAPEAAAAPVEEEAGGSRRRIPTRLVPWACAVCTFENKGGEPKCQMCATAKGAETPPPAVVAVAAAAPGATASPAPGTAAVAAAGLAVTGGKDATSGRAPAKKEARRGAAAAQQRKLTTSKKTRSRGAAVDAADAPVETPAAAPAAAAAAWPSAPQPWVLLGSGLDAAGKEALAALAAASGAAVAEAWAPEVTHIVCAGADGAAARRTFKLLMGVLHGRWVVTQEWAAACLAAGGPQGEERFEVRADGAGGGCGAAAARQAGSPAARHLLRGFDVQLQGEFGNRGQVEALLRAAGAAVVTRLPGAGGAARDTRSAKALSGGGGVVLVEVPDASEAAAAGFRAAVAAQPWFARALASGVPVVAHRWATDSVSRFQACPLDAYLVRP